MLLCICMCVHVLTHIHTHIGEGAGTWQWHHGPVSYQSSILQIFFIPQRNFICYPQYEDLLFQTQAIYRTPQLAHGHSLSGPNAMLGLRAISNTHTQR